VPAAGESCAGALLPGNVLFCQLFAVSQLPFPLPFQVLSPNPLRGATAHKSKAMPNAIETGMARNIFERLGIKKLLMEGEMHNIHLILLGQAFCY
jgi:hypothetical protein